MGNAQTVVLEATGIFLLFPPNSVSLHGLNAVNYLSLNEGIVNGGRHIGADTLHSQGNGVGLQSDFPLFPNMTSQHNRLQFGVKIAPGIYHRGVASIFASGSVRRQILPLFPVLPTVHDCEPTAAIAGQPPVGLRPNRIIPEEWARSETPKDEALLSSYRNLLVFSYHIWKGEKEKGGCRFEPFSCLFRPKSRMSEECKSTLPFY